MKKYPGDQDPPIPKDRIDEIRPEPLVHYNDQMLLKFWGGIQGL